MYTFLEKHSVFSYIASITFGGVSAVALQLTPLLGFLGALLGCIGALVTLLIQLKKYKKIKGKDEK